MRYVSMLIVVTAMIFVPAGSTRAVTSPGPLMLDITAVVTPANDTSDPPRSKSCPPNSGNPGGTPPSCGKGNNSNLP
jgi:hypothetical protein